MFRSFALFFIIVLLVWTGMHAYVLWRLESVPAISHLVPRTLLIAVFACSWSFYLVARFLDRAGINWLSQPLEWVGANWLGVLFITLVTFFAADIVTGFGYLLPRAAQGARATALLAAVALCIFAVVQARRTPVVREYEVTVPGLPAASDGTSIVVISDTHLGAMLGADWLARRVTQVDQLKPDVLILAGDIVEGDERNYSGLIPQLRRLSAPLGVYAVSGNHEFYAGLDRSRRLFEQAGIRMLRDEWIELRPGLVLAGVDDLTTRRRIRRDAGVFIDRALANRPAGAATVFVSHSPLYPDRAARDGAHVMLSGHTHNGQIWPFTYVVRTMYPLTGGSYDVNGMKAFVCRGAGTWGPRMRLWGPSEILRVKLRSPT